MRRQGPGGGDKVYNPPLPFHPTSIHTIDQRPLLVTSQRKLLYGPGHLFILKGMFIFVD